jgi:pimeloyl-ACP methyl ester carboxylesterase
MKRFLIRWIGLPSLVFAILFAGVLFYRAHLQAETAKLLEISTPRGIQEGMFIPVGGIDQWITIRGEDRDNPVILLVHGGPGLTTSPVAVWFRSWERDFTVVHWDQRGAGKTYGRYRDGTPDMSVSRIIDDGYEVAEFLRNHLQKDKIVLVGHSWGAAIGIVMARNRPDLFAAYVGTGQTVDTTRTDAGNYQWLLEAVRTAGDRESLDALEVIGAPPYDSPVKEQTARRIAIGYLPTSESGYGYVWRAIQGSLSSPDMSWRDLGDGSAGAQFSAPALLSGGGDYRVRSDGLDFQIPMFFIQGEADIVTPTPLVKELARDITSPHTEMVVIPGAGHNVMLTMPNAFHEHLLARVRPLVTPRAQP